MAEKKGYNRRDFLKIVGASSGVAAAGCAQELPEKLLPYVVQPDDVIPGVAAWYAGTCGECDAGCGVLVRTREGRVTKVEGNKAHPINRGGLCSRGQSAVQGLYDPDRIREPLQRGVNGTFKPADWKTTVSDLAQKLSTTAKAGKEIAILSRSLGPSESALLEELSASVKGIKRYEYTLLNTDSLTDAARAVFGGEYETHFNFAKADVVLGVGADYLETWLSPMAQTKDFAARRRPGKNTQLSKVFHVEPRLSLTAANADTWIKNTPGAEHRILQALLLELTQGEYAVSSAARNQLVSVFGALKSEAILEGAGVTQEQIVSLAGELASAKQSLVVAGGAACSGAQGQLCAELAFYLNYLLGNFGESVELHATSRKSVNRGWAGVGHLLKAIEKDAVGAVIVVDTNPNYALPASLGFSEALAKVPLVVALDTQLHETAIAAHVVLPGLTNFESWNDSEPLPGIRNLNQPAMQPLYPGIGFGDFLIALGADDAIGIDFGDVESFHDYLKQQWDTQVTGEGLPWLKAVEAGGSWARKPSSSPGVQVNPAAAKQLPVADTTKLAVLTFPTVHLGDGSSANRPWAQEVPDPMTTSVWGSWIEMHPLVAQREGVNSGDTIRLRTDAGSIEAPVYITSHIQENTLGVPLGQGHDGFGRFATGIGANALALLPSDEGALSFFTEGARFAATVGKDELVITQGHDSQLDRGLARTVGLKEFEKLGGHHEDHGHGKDNAHGGAHGSHGAASTAAAYGLKDFHLHDTKALGPQKEPKQMYEQMEHVQYRWGMSVDLASCTGCSACVTACYAENNVPVVGKELCAQGREMSWIRIDRYFDENEDSPVTAFSPVMCQHCNNAPCEPVCPVYATYHSEEGLNTMVYNRCVGTRYCSNNCSYKVRRFNWFKYEWPEPLNWQLNPDVTVRSVGVMEKCSFCIQRIREGQNTAKDLGREVLDGEISPACASSCPADAIVFGDLNNKESGVYKKSQSQRSYRMLNVELNTQPSVYYLAKVVHDDEKKPGQKDKEVSHS